MRVKYILLSILAVCFLSSCYEDHSATDFKLINSIEIDFGGMSTSLTVFQLDTLEIQPIVYKNGVKDEDLYYEWKVQGRNYPETVLAHTMVFKQKIELVPSSDAYTLVLTVADTTTSIRELARLTLKVESRYGEGLWVADTRDEMNSDLSLIMAMNFTRGIYNEKDNRIYHDIYSLQNGGQKIPGLVKEIQAVHKYDSKVLTFMTETDIYRVDPYDLTDWQRNSDLFYVPLDEVKPSFMLKKDYAGDEFIVNDGKIHYRNPSWGNLFYGFYLFTTNKSDYKLSHALCTGSGYYTTSPIGYDELNHRFIQANSRNDAMMLYSEQHADLVFDVNNIGPFEVISMSEGEDWDVVSVLKSEEGHQYYIYTIQTRTTDNGSNLPTGKYDISDCPDIRNAHSFVASPISGDFYYATKDKIYTLALQRSTDQPKEQKPVAYERYTVNSEENPGEEITSMILWRDEYQRMMVPSETSTSGETQVNAQNRMLILTTYNKNTKEGKVITVPIIRTADGTLATDRKFHREYTGFGRITRVGQNKIGS